MLLIRSSVDAKRYIDFKRSGEMKVFSNIQCDDDDRGLLLFMVIFIERMFSIECLISEDDEVFGLLSIDEIELLSSSSSDASFSSEEGFVGTALGGG